MAGPGRVGGPEDPLELVEVMPAEVGEEGRQVVVGGVGERPDEIVAPGYGAALEEPLARLRAGPPDEDLVLLVLHVVDASLEGAAARTRERVLEASPVLRLEGMPAGGGEHPLDTPDADAGHDPVEALTVEVDDHGDIAQATQRVLEIASQTLPSSSSASPTVATNRRSG